MDEGSGTKRGSSRRRRLGLALGGVALALVVAIAGVLALLPVDSCACLPPLDLVVQNYSRQDASVSWSQPGLFGTPLRGLSRGGTAARCSTLSATLRRGEVQVSVTATRGTRTFTLHIREDGTLFVTTAIVIAEDGSISDPIYGDPPGGLRQFDTLC